MCGDLNKQYLSVDAAVVLYYMEGDWIGMVGWMYDFIRNLEMIYFLLSMILIKCCAFIYLFPIVLVDRLLYRLLRRNFMGDEILYFQLC